MKKLCSLIIIVLILFCNCTKKTTDSSTPIAVYSLGSGGNCTGVIVSGRYVADTALTSANTITISVDVSVPGPYWISTNVVNGISFSAISTFTSTGPQTAVLTGTGAPIAIDTSEFTIVALNGLGGSCTFSLGTIQGTIPPYYITCFLNGVFRNFTDSASATNTDTIGTSGSAGLYIRGLDTVINSISKVEFGVNGVAAVGAGTYTDTSTVSIAYFNYVDSLNQTWTVHSNSQPSFTINVMNISANYAQGTFSGMIKNEQGTDSIAITNGLFSIPVK